MPCKYNYLLNLIVILIFFNMIVPCVLTNSWSAYHIRLPLSIPVGEDPGYIATNYEENKLYVANSGSQSVFVISTENDIYYL